MDKFLLPSNFKVEEVDKPNAARIIIEPCYHGYGTTLGNALRRVLLSSLPGAAVTAVKIKGATHEFATLEHVQEDVVEIILNLKKLRLRIFTPEEVRLTLSAKGEGVVSAAQIETTSDVEIVNSDLTIATLTNKEAKLEMEIFVSSGRGYVPVEEKSNLKLELGTVVVDSIFNPVINVGYKVEFVRVGQITDYEKLILDIETDGTISPLNALLQSTKIIQDHINLILENFGGSAETHDFEEIVPEKESDLVEIKKEEAGEAPIEKKEKRGRKKGSTNKKKK